jgi:hypothetical protein
MSFRVIDGGMVSWLDSQVIYHAVASAMSGTKEPTLTLVNPSKPYICIGYHWEQSKQILVEEIAKSLQQDAHLDRLSEREQAEMVRWRETLTSDEWLYQAGGLRHKGLKIKVISFLFKTDG